MTRVMILMAPGPMNVAVCGLLMLASASFAEPVSAQLLIAPGEIVIHVNSDVRNTEFVEPLVCELSKVVQAPIRARKIDIPLTDELIKAGRQYSPRKIAPRFAAATAGESALAHSFRYLIVDHDLKVSPLNYVFAETYVPPLSVISVTRLSPTVEPHAAKRAAVEIILPRVYKLMMKSIAVMSGLRTTGCVMSFPKSLPELDAKSSEFCPDDRAALVAAKVIRGTSSPACGNVVAAR